MYQSDNDDYSLWFIAVWMFVLVSSLMFCALMYNASKDFQPLEDTPATNITMQAEASRL